MQNIKCEKPDISNFSISKTKIREYHRFLETSKASGLNNIPPIFC